MFGLGKLWTNRLRLSSGSFAPIMQYEKREIHTVFPHFPHFLLEQNLSLSALADLIRASLEIFSSFCKYGGQHLTILQSFYQKARRMCISYQKRSLFSKIEKFRQKLVDFIFSLLTIRFSLFSFENYRLGNKYGEEWRSKGSIADDLNFCESSNLYIALPIMIYSSLS